MLVCNHFNYMEYFKLVSISFGEFMVSIAIYYLKILTMKYYGMLLTSYNKFILLLKMFEFSFYYCMLKLYLLDSSCMSGNFSTICTFIFFSLSKPNTIFWLVWFGGSLNYLPSYIGLRLKTLGYYQSYTFKLYLEKIRLLLFEGLIFSPWVFPRLIVPLECGILQSLIDLAKLFSLFYLNYSYDYTLSLSGTFNSSMSKTCFLLGSLSFATNYPVVTLKAFKMKLFLPVKYLCGKLRGLGFMHYFQVRPMGNVRYLKYSDLLMMQSFGYIAFSFLFWYSIVTNFSSMKILLEFLSNSCLLTLCRKHNKGKLWAFSVYTSNIVMLKMFNNSSCAERFLS